MSSGPPRRCPAYCRRAGPRRAQTGRARPGRQVDMAGKSAAAPSIFKGKQQAAGGPTWDRRQPLISYCR